MAEAAGIIKRLRYGLARVLRPWLFPGWPEPDEAAHRGLDAGTIARELIRHAASGVASGSVVHVLLALLFVWGIADEATNPALFLWLAAMVVAAGIRGGLCALGVRRLAEDPAFAKRALVLPAMLTGAAWAALAVLCYTGEGGPQDLFIVFVIGGVCLGSLAVSGAYLPAYYAFYLTAFPPLVAVVFTRGAGSEPTAMGLMLTVYFLAVLLYARRFSRTLVEQIIARMSEEAMRAELAEVRDMLEAALESRRDSFAVFDENDRLLFWNRPFARGLEPLVGRLRRGVRFVDLIRASAAAAARAAGTDPEAWIAARLAQHRNPGPPFEQQVDGRWILVQEYRTPRGHTVLVHTDISELKAREHALRDSEAEKAGILEAALDAVVTIDGEGRIIDFNAAAQRLFGWRADEVVGRRFTRIFVPVRHRAWLERAIRRFVETGATPDFGRRFETEALTRNGEEIPVEVSIAHVRTAAGELFAGFIRDMRARKRAEAALKAARDAAEAASRAKTEFLATISHEIRTPMHGILGALELLADMPLEPEARRLVRAAIGAGQALRSLLDELIDVSRIESGHLVLERVPFDLPQLLASTAEIFRHQAEAKGLVLDVALADDLPQTVVSDPARLRQVLFNLLSNAVKYTDEGTVTLEAGRRAGGDGFAVIDITVRDTGPGIPPEQRERIFEKFSRGESGRRAGEGGLGLGLAVARSLVELMGGTLALDSRPGAGSAFTLRLPLLLAREPAGEAGEDAQAGRPEDGAAIAGARVLVVDDSATNRLVIAEMLRRAGAEPLEAGGGREALALVARVRVDAVLMDIAMPEIDGFAALAALREAGVAVPVVALTAHAGPEERERMLAAGFAAHLPKPVSRGLLVRTLAAVIASGRGRDAGGGPSHPGAKAAFEAPAAEDAAGDVSPLVSRFRQELKMRRAALREAAAGGDRAAIALHAHALSSAAGFLGEEELADLMRALEAAAIAPEPAAETLQQMLEEADAVMAAVLARMTAGRPGLQGDPAAG